MERTPCPICNSVNVICTGFSKNSKREFLCRNCHKRYRGPNRYIGQLREFTEQEKAWLACAIDSEGSICLYRTKGHDAKNKYERYVIELKIGNTNRAFLDYSKHITGTGWIASFYKANRKGYKPVLQWVVRRRYSIFQILTQVLPYLIIKKEQANIAITLCEFAMRRKLGANIGIQEHALISAMIERNRFLNRRGVVRNTVRDSEPDGIAPA